MSIPRTSHRVAKLCASALLAVACTAFGASPARAINAVGGSAISTTVQITSTAFQTLASQSFTLNGGPHTCMAVVSAWAKNPGSATNRYNFAVRLESSSGVSFSLRKIEFLATSELAQIVSTNFTFFDVANGDHTIAFIGQKEASNMSAVDVKRPSLSIVCTKQELTLAP